MMSVGLFALFIVWVIDGHILAKLKAFYANKTALLISSIYIITVIGLIHTANFDFALDDLRRKLPLFFIPFFVAGFSSISKKEFYMLLHVYLFGVLIATFWSLFVYLGGLGELLIDSRSLSRFNSHIRFGLEIALAIFISVYFLFQSKNIPNKLLWLTLSCWLISSLVIFRLFSGLLIFNLSTLFLLVVFSFQTKSSVLKCVTIAIFLCLTIGAGSFLYNVIIEFKESRIEKTIDKKTITAQGNKYKVDLKTINSTIKENGYFIEKHIAEQEFSEAWNSKSTINYKDLDNKGNKLRFTLRRFISSKGERKDAAAIERLSPLEITSIENGVPNFNYLQMGYFKTRLFKILWEYQAYKDSRSINGHSVLMRWEYWNTAVQIINENLLFGVGTGDVQDSFDAQYEKTASSLEKKYRRRTHNQFLTYAVSLGVFGAFSFLILLFYPLSKRNIYKNYIYFAFIGIIALSMLTEDTLEVQAGINLFAFFNTLLLLKQKDPKQYDENIF
jgi:hypothetical protein